MSNLIHELKNPTLEYLVHQCRSLQELKQMLGNDEANYLISSMFYRNYLNNKYKSVVHPALYESLEIASTPVEWFWMTISFLTLGSAATLIAGLVALLTVAAFCGGFYYHYYKNKNKIVEDKEFIQLAIIQSYALDVLLTRYKPHYWLEPVKAVSAEPPVSFSKKAAICMGISNSALLMTVFYWGITESLVAIGLVGAASMLGGPIGLAVAAVIAVTIGIIIAVKYYEASKHKKVIAKLKTALINDIMIKKSNLEIFKQLQTYQHTVPSTEDAKDEKIIEAPLKRSLSQTFFSEKTSVPANKFSYSTELKRCAYI